MLAELRPRSFADTFNPRRCSSSLVSQERAPFSLLVQQDNVHIMIFPFTANSLAARRYSSLSQALDSSARNLRAWDTVNLMFVLRHLSLTNIYFFTQNNPLFDSVRSPRTSAAWSLPAVFGPISTKVRPCPELLD